MMNRNICPVGYVEVTDIKIMQKLLLQLMIKFHEVCEKHGLVYNLCGGTLLGAVRHRGFIPWDDDLDVCMPRADYEKFIEIVQKEYSETITLEKPLDEGYVGPFVKIGMPGTVLFEKLCVEKYAKRNLYIDVFPVDGYPDLSEGARKVHLDKVKIAARNMQWAGYRVCPPEKTWRRRLLWIPKFFIFNYYRLQGPHKYIKQFLDLTQKYKFEDCDKVTLNWVYWGRTWIAKDKFLDRVLYDFEGYKFWSVRDYDDWLTRFYGDYMTPPPPEKRVQYHGYKLYVKKELLKGL